MNEIEKEVLSKLIDTAYHAQQNAREYDLLLVNIARKLDLPNKEVLTTAYFHAYGTIIKD